jgi:hypothetical protein
MEFHLKAKKAGASLNLCNLLEVNDVTIALQLSESLEIAYKKLAHQLSPFNLHPYDYLLEPIGEDS